MLICEGHCRSRYIVWIAYDVILEEKIVIIILHTSSIYFTKNESSISSKVWTCSNQIWYVIQTSDLSKYNYILKGSFTCMVCDSHYTWQCKQHIYISPNVLKMLSILFPRKFSPGVRWFEVGHIYICLFIYLFIP